MIQKESSAMYVYVVEYNAQLSLGGVQWTKETSQGKELQHTNDRVGFDKSHYFLTGCNDNTHCFGSNIS
jgi:hypothetical protein